MNYCPQFSPSFALVSSWAKCTSLLTFNQRSRIMRKCWIYYTNYILHNVGSGLSNPCKGVVLASGAGPKASAWEGELYVHREQQWPTRAPKMS